MTKKVLLCDDEPHILRAAEIKLQRNNFEVRTANDGEAAWEIIQQWMPDCLVTDYQMPRLDGMGLCRRIREHEHTAHLPILMLTAKGFELAYEEVREQLGVRAILSKPFSPRELLACVEELAETGECRPLNRTW